VDDWAGEGPRYPVHRLDLGDDEPAEIVDVFGLGAHDNVIRPGHVLRLGHSWDLRDPGGNLRGLTDLGLDEDVCVDHDVLPGGLDQRMSSTGNGHAIAHPDATRSPEVSITIGELGEFGLIAAMAARMPAAPDAIVGIGDDAAVLRVPDSQVVASMDLLVEGLHFRRDWSGPADIGCKAAAQNLADVAAMGAVPEAVLVGLAAPPDVPVSWARDVASGLADEAARGGAYVVGGDLSGADRIVLAVTAIGTMAGREPVTRGGARPSDLVAVAGRLGHSAAGFALLSAGLTEPAGAVAAHRRPRPPYEAGPQAAAAGATSMIDVSDGLIADLGHIAEASGVLIDIETAKLDTGGLVLAAAQALGLASAEPRPHTTATPGARVAEPGSQAAVEPEGVQAPLRWVLTGGEDHALAATFPANTVIPAGWLVIGRVYEGQGVRVDGKNYSAEAGWRHFR